MVKSVIMEEVNNLELIRQKIEEVEDLTKEEIRELVSKVIDSYTRSVDINKIINDKVDTMIEQRVRIVELMKHLNVTSMGTYLEVRFQMIYKIWFLMIWKNSSMKNIDWKL